MKKLFHKKLAYRWLRPTFVTLWSPLILASAAFAQATGSSPWENAVNVLMTAFTSTIARGLSLVAIVRVRVDLRIWRRRLDNESLPVCSLGLAWPLPQ